MYISFHTRARIAIVGEQMYAMALLRYLRTVDSPFHTQSSLTQAASRVVLDEASKLDRTLTRHNACYVVSKCMLRHPKRPRARAQRYVATISNCRYLH